MDDMWNPRIELSLFELNSLIDLLEKPDGAAMYRLRGRLTEVRDRLYDPAFGDDKICECGDPYYRHFDTYEGMEPVGCKYCPCWSFKEKVA